MSTHLLNYIMNVYNIKKVYHFYGLMSIWLIFKDNWFWKSSILVLSSYMNTIE